MGQQGENIKGSSESHPTAFNAMNNQHPQRSHTGARTIALLLLLYRAQPCVIAPIPVLPVNRSEAPHAAPARRQQRGSCIQEGCTKVEHHAKGFCKLHYRRWWRQKKRDEQPLEKRDS